MRTRAPKAHALALLGACLTVLLGACSAGAKDGSTAALRFDKPAAGSDPFNDPVGPYFHDVYRATSPDGLTFGAPVGPVIEKMSVPDVIRLPGGRLMMYGVDGAARSKSGLMVARSDNGGKSWTLGSVQLRGSTEAKADSAQVRGADPDVIRLASGALRLYYIVFEGPPPTPGSPPGQGQRTKVMSATSRDGVSFRQESGTRYQGDGLLTDPDVVKIGRRWFMYISQGERLQVACSTSGKSFKPCGTVRERGSVSTTVKVGKRRWRQFFCRDGISSATTSDGRSWSDDPGTRVAVEGKTVCDPAPVRIPRADAKSRWSLWFKAGPAPPMPPQPPLGG